MAGTSTILISALVMFFAPYLVTFFNAKPEVVSFGTLFLHYLTPFYFVCCINQIYAGALRGSGNSRAPMIIMLFSFVFSRQIYLFVMAKFISNTILPIAMGYPFGWIVCTALLLPYYHRTSLEKSVLVSDSNS